MRAPGNIPNNSCCDSLRWCLSIVYRPLSRKRHYKRIINRSALWRYFTGSRAAQRKKSVISTQRLLACISITISESDKSVNFAVVSTREVPPRHAALVISSFNLPPKSCYYMSNQNILSFSCEFFRVSWFDMYNCISVTIRYCWNIWHVSRPWFPIYATLFSR